MKKQGGKINMIALLVVALVIIVMFFCYVFFLKDIMTEEEPIIENTTGAEIVENTTEKPEVKPEDKKKIASTDFDYKFLLLEAEENKNLVYSPLSIKTALKMLTEGANGETKAELDTLLEGVDLNSYKSFGEKLSFANGLFIHDTFKDSVKEDYVNTLKNKYEAEVNFDSFKSADNVNKWIEEKTLGIIKNLLSDDQVEEAEIVLANALAIDMNFKVPFEDNNTHSRDFEKAGGEKIEAAMMNGTFERDEVSYLEDDEKIAFTTELEDLDDANLEFMAVMPKEKALNEYVKDFNKDSYDSINENLKTSSSHEGGVRVAIPRFEFDYALKLKEDLKKLGINLAFDDQFADFSNMADEPLHVDDAIHKADFKFSEKGVKAAAVTVIIMVKNAAFIEEPAKPIELTFDKPFMFFIRDKQRNDIWFVGTMYEPDLWEKVQGEYTSKMY